ncbi:MAG: hypothetical protein KC609_12195, partial [Myxococcales bacterium]|nr:hypothetical protein [Myxococcales bacterium]
TVGPLSPDEALAMARQLLRDSTLTGGQTAEELARESSGIPLFLAELVRYAREKSGDSTQPTSEDPETTLQSLLEIRLSRLPQNSLKLLRVLCIFGQPLAVGQAYQAARLSDSDREPLNRLVNDSLVRFTRQRRDSEEVEPQHDRIRETVLFQMSESDVRGITRSLAESFEKLDTTEPEILGQFYERVGDAEKTAVYMAQAAEKAAGQLAFHHAAELFRRALANSSTVEMAQHLTTRLAEVLISLGRGVEAARLFLSAVENADETTAIHLRRRAADQLLRSGHFDEGIAALRTVLDAQKQAWPETPSKAIWSLVRSRARLWLRGLRFTRRHENAIDPELLERIETTWSAAIGMSMIDVFRGADFQTRNLLYALQAGDPYRVSRAMSMEAAFVASFGLPSRDKSEMLMTLARDLADEIGHPHARALSLLVEGVASFLWGEWTRCFKFCERSEKMFRDECTGVAWELANCKIYSFASLFYMGELGDMMHGMPIYLREAREVGDLYSSAMLRTFFHNAVLLADDNPRLAQQNLKEVGESWSHDGFHVQHFFQMLAQASVLLYESDPMAAWDHINGRLPALRSSQLHRIQFVRCELAYIVGRVALSLSATGYEREAMLGVASKQALLLERERADWAAPYALLLQSGVLAQRGDIEAAIVSLASAERGFDQQSMALFGACARRRRGGLLHGDHGRKLVRESEAMMSTQKIRNPQRWTELFVPGSSNLEGSE